MEKSVLVTGGAGFVGSHLIDELLKQGKKVIAYDLADLAKCRNLDGARSNPNFSYIQGDIRDKNKLALAFTKPLSIVYHLASIVGIPKYIDDPFGLIDIVIGGTRNVGELALQHKVKVLLTSTSEIYGKNPKIPWNEEDDRVLGKPSIDRWSYSSSKAVCEHMLFALHRQKGLDLTVVRYFNVYGPRQSPIFVVSQSVHKVLNGEAPLLYDKGVMTRCFTYIDDAIRGTLAAAESPNSNGEIFNIGNSVETSMKEAVETVIKHSGKNMKYQDLDTKAHYGKTYEDIQRRVPDVSKAKRVLGWQVQIGHDEGIRRTVEWAKENTWWLQPK